MDNSHVDVTFDFDDQYLQEKEVFLDYLSGENWINLNSDQLWRVQFNQSLSIEDQLLIIRKSIENASKVSQIKAVDYVLISEEAVYFNKID